MTAAGPLRGPHKGGGCAAAVLAAPAKRTGPPPRPPGCSASPCGRRPCGPPWTPGTPAAPGNRKSGQATACPGQTRAHQGQPALATITTTEVSTLRGEPRGPRVRFEGCRLAKDGLLLTAAPCQPQRRQHARVRPRRLRRQRTPACVHRRQLADRIHLRQQKEMTGQPKCRCKKI